jgi:hypothetical protein
MGEAVMTGIVEGIKKSWEFAGDPNEVQRIADVLRDACRQGSWGEMVSAMAFDSLDGGPAAVYTLRHGVETGALILDAVPVLIERARDGGGGACAAVDSCVGC